MAGVSKDGISKSAVNNTALTATVLIVMTSVPVSFACGLIIGVIDDSMDSTLRIAMSSIVGVSLTSFYYLRKLMGAMAYEGALQGVSEELWSIHHDKNQ